jgi:hypothetical protein
MMARSVVHREHAAAFIRRDASSGNSFAAQRGGKGDQLRSVLAVVVEVHASWIAFVSWVIFAIIVASRPDPHAVV